MSNRIERGVTFASLTTLLDLTGVLHCELQDLFEVNPATPEAIEIRSIRDLLKGRPLALAQSAKQQVEIPLAAVGPPTKKKS